MSILKSIFYTAASIIIIEISSLWLLLDQVLNIEWLIDYYSFISIIISTTLVLIFLHIVQPSEEISIKKTNPKFYLLAVFLGVLYVFIQYPLNFIYCYIVDIAFNPSFSYQLGWANVLGFNAMASFIFVPITEELYFRNFIQASLQKRYSPFVSISVATVLFSIIHIPFYALFIEFYTLDFHHAYIAFFGGMISGVLYHRSKSVGPSIIMHLFWNLTVIVI